MKAPDTIESSEELGREIFSSNQAKRAARNTIPKNVFLEREGVAKLSVDRLSVAPIEEVIINADKVAAKRNRTFYGWAALIALDACLNERKVLASPT